MLSVAGAKVAKKTQDMINTKYVAKIMSNDWGF